MTVLFLMALMTAAGVWIADRWFRVRPWACGAWFGLLAVVADVFGSVSLTANGVELLLRDGPVAASALFFGPVAGLVSGAVAAAESAVLDISCSGEISGCFLATFAVAAVAAAVGRWFLDRQRPVLVQALASAFVFEVFHLVFDLLFESDELGRCCEIIFNAFIPETLAMMAALALSTAAVRSVGSFARNFRSGASVVLLSFVFFGVIVARLTYANAVADTVERGGNAKRRLRFVFNAQIDFMMHHDALLLADAVGTLRDMTQDEVGRIIGDSRYDEMCVVDAKGRVRGANDPKLLTFDFATHPQASRYLDLARGKEVYIGEPFRASGLDGINIKYGGVPLPDLSGFIQLGYTRRRLDEEFGRFFFPIFDRDIRVFESDFYMIASTNDGRIAVASLDEEAFEGRTVGEFGIPDCGFARVRESWCYVDSMTVGGWRIYCLLPIYETFGPAAVQCGVELLLIFAFMFCFRMVMLRFRKQREKIDQLRAEADERLHQDLLNAQKIQISYLPATLPSGDGFTVTARMLPAREVGGDFYDAFRMKDGRIALVVADVSGKGVPAAMFMIKAKSRLASELSARSSLAEAVECANAVLCENNYAEMFVTAWIGVWDPSAGRIEYVNAGHNPPILRRSDGSVEWIRERGGIALAVMPGVPYRTHELTLASGDGLLLYTDGVSEAMNTSGELYGEDRLARFFAASGTDVISGLFLDLASFAFGAEQSDDITAVHLALG